MKLWVQLDNRFYAVAGLFKTTQAANNFCEETNSTKALPKVGVLGETENKIIVVAHCKAKVGEIKQ